MNRLPLTSRQRDILRWITTYRDTRGYSPSIRDIMDAFGIRSPHGVCGHLKALRIKGWIEPVELQEKGRSRTVRPAVDSEPVGIVADVEWMLS